MASYTEIGSRLRTARESKGWTQRDVARRLKVTPQAVSMLESGQARTNIERIEQYAQAVGCELVAEIITPGDRAGSIAGRAARLAPLLDDAEAASLLALLDLWERRHRGESHAAG